MTIKSTIGIAGFLALFVLISISFAGLSGPAPIPAPPTFNIHTNQTILCKGLTNFIPITVVNTGGSTVSTGAGPSNVTVVGGTTMQSVQLSITPSKTLLLEGNGTATIGSVKPASSVTARIPVFVANNASLITTVEVGVNYYYLQLYSDSETRNLTFETAQCPSQLSVNMTPKTLTSGEIQNVTIKLRNNGNIVLTNLNVRWALPALDGAVVGSQQTNIASLAPGNTYQVNASIFVSRNASIESFPVNLTATFYSNGSLEQVLNSTSIVPTGAINLHPSGLTLSPSAVSPGGIFSVSFVLTDIGTSGASAASAYAILPQNFSAYGSNPVYIGDIAADAQAPVTVTLVAGPHTRLGNYTIPIKINYLNGLRQNQTETMNVPVNVTNSNSTRLGSGTSPNGVRVTTGSGSSGLIELVLLIALAIVGWLYYNERKKNKKQRHQQ